MRRRDGLADAQRQYERGRVADALSLLSQERRRALEADDSARLDELDALVTAMFADPAGSRRDLLPRPPQGGSAPSRGTSAAPRRGERAVANEARAQERRPPPPVSAEGVALLVTVLETNRLERRRFYALRRLRELQASETFASLPEDLRERVREIVAGSAPS